MISRPCNRCCIAVYDDDICPDCDRRVAYVEAMQPMDSPFPLNLTEADL